MAGTLSLRPTASVYTRAVLLLTGRTCYYSVKGAACVYFTNGQIPEHARKRSIYLPEGRFSLLTCPAESSLSSAFAGHFLSRSTRCYRIFNDKSILLFSTKNTCRLLSYSFCRKTSNNNTNSVNNCYNGKEKENINVVNLQSKSDDPEFKSILSDVSTDFDNDSELMRIKNETIGDEEEQLQQRSVSVDSRKTDKSLHLHSANVNKIETVQTDFEYDYQVAEDIEEYDYLDESRLAEQQVRPEKVLPISLQRGKTGVFDLDELVTFLEHLGAENIVTFPVPPEANFCDHMVVVSAKSHRHLQAINDELLWVHKRKKSKKDHHLVIEGKDKSTWCAMDMGNIVLHVFFGDDKREYYDIESLWTLGPEHDPKCQEQHSDPYALSPEDLFWLETRNTVKVTDTANMDTEDNDKEVKSSQAKVEDSKK